jgi:hypothetical protein
MERNGLTADEAFKVLRQISQRTNAKLRDVAPESWRNNQRPNNRLIICHSPGPGGCEPAAGLGVGRTGVSPGCDSGVGAVPPTSVASSSRMSAPCRS